MDFVITEGIWSTPHEIAILSWADNFASLSLKF